MTKEQPITGRQLRRLQTLWRLLSSFHGFDGQDRAVRLAWVGQAAGRQVASSKDLTRTEAAKVIDRMQECVPAHLVRKGKARPGRELARRMGTEGRRSRPDASGFGSDSKLTGPPDARSLELLAELRHATGFDDEDKLRAWLRSRNSPTRGSTTLSTLAKVNAVIWGLKRMIRRQKKISHGSTAPAGVSA